MTRPVPSRDRTAAVALAHADVIVSDTDRALAFYVGLLGGAVADDAVLEGAVPAFYSDGRATRMRLTMIRFAAPGAMLELMSFTPPLPATPGGLHVSLLVGDLAAALARLATAGVAAASELLAVELPRLGRARIAFVRDPDGYLVELVEPT